MVKDNFVSVYEEKPSLTSWRRGSHMADQFHMVKKGEKLWRKSEEAQSIRESRLRKEINCK